MVKKHLEVEKAAIKLGFTNFPVTVLYGRPKSFRHRTSVFDKILSAGILQATSGIFTDTVWIITNLLNLKYQLKPEKLKNINKPSDKPRFFFGYGLEKRLHYYYFLAPTVNLYIELINRAGITMKKHGFQLKIYSSEEEHKYTIAKTIDDLYGGILNYVDNWEKIEEYFNVTSDECIKTWNSLLKQS